MAFGISAGTIISAGAGLAGAAISANAAGGAADTQAAATDRANAKSEAQYKQTREDLAPYRDYGSSATNKLAELLGLTSPNTTARARSDYIQTVKSSLESQGRADEFNPNWSPDDAAVQRFIDQNQDKYSSTSGASGSLLKPFTGADLENEPGYKFGLQEGQTALDNRFAAGGSYFSGAALKGATKFAQDYAGTKYGEAYNRDASTKRQTYDFLNGGVSIGQNASAQTGNAGAQMAGQVGANTTALGNAQGASQIAQGNAISGALTNGINSYQQNQLMQAILGGNKGFGSFTNNPIG